MVRAFLARDTIGSGSVGRLTHSGIWTLPPSRSTTITSTYTQKNTGQWIHPLTHHIPYCLTNVWFKLGTNIHYIENIYLFQVVFTCFGASYWLYFHLRQHLFTSKKIFLFVIKYYHVLLHMVLANWKHEILEAFTILFLLGVE